MLRPWLLCVVLENVLWGCGIDLVCTVEDLADLLPRGSEGMGSLYGQMRCVFNFSSVDHATVVFGAVIRYELVRLLTVQLKLFKRLG